MIHMLVWLKVAQLGVGWWGSRWVGPLVAPFLFFSCFLLIIFQKKKKLLKFMMRLDWPFMSAKFRWFRSEISYITSVDGMVWSGQPTGLAVQWVIFQLWMVLGLQRFLPPNQFKQDPFESFFGPTAHFSPTTIIGFGPSTLVLFVTICGSRNESLTFSLKLFSAGQTCTSFLLVITQLKSYEQLRQDMT